MAETPESRPHRDPPAAGEIVSTRVFDAPRAAVFRAFTDPSRLSRWWGPSGFTNIFQQFDPRPGGAWRFVMRGPDGAEYHNASDFVEVLPGERIVLDHLEAVHSFRMWMTYADEAGGTRLTWRMHFHSAEHADTVRDVIQVANEQNFDRLDAELRAMAGDRKGHP